MQLEITKTGTVVAVAVEQVLPVVMALVMVLQDQKLQDQEEMV